MVGRDTGKGKAQSARLSPASSVKAKKGTLPRSADKPSKRSPSVQSKHAKEARSRKGTKEGSHPSSAREGDVIPSAKSARSIEPTKSTKRVSHTATLGSSQKKRKREGGAAQVTGAKRALKRERGPKEADGGEQVVDKLLDELRQKIENDESEGGDSEDAFDDILGAIAETADADDEFESEDESDSDLEVESDPADNTDGEDTVTIGKVSGDENPKSKNLPNGRKNASEGKGLAKASVEENKDASSGDEGDASRTLGMHKHDLESLKVSDPSFYKYLQENDVGLLNIDESDSAVGISESDDDTNDENASHPSGSDTGDGEKEAKNRTIVGTKASMASRTRTEHSADESSEDSDALAEAQALAEAGLDGSEIESQSSESEAEDENVGTGQGRRVQKKKSHVVDMETVRELEKQLDLNRGALKAVKDLLRMLRAGRNLSGIAQESAPTKADKTATGKAKAKLKAKARAKARSSTSDGDDASPGSDGDDYSAEAESGFVAGDVTFTSARVYQRVMYLAVVRVQEALDKVLGKPKRAGTSLAERWCPADHSRWRNVTPLVRSFVSQFLALADSMQDPATLRFLLKRAELLVPYTRKDIVLTRRLVKLALSAWSPESRDVSEATKLRAYLLLRAIGGVGDNVETVLRAVYNAYSSTISKACNPRTLPNILFSAKCIVDLFGIDMAVSYKVLFSYLREMAVTLRSVLTSKDEKKDSDKVHNWSFVNSLRLWSMVLSTYGSEEELRPLIYPFVQVAIGTLRIQPTPRTYPLRLHIASYLTNIISETGVYIPVATQLLPLLRCTELRRKPTRGTSKDLEWRALLRVGDDIVKTKPFLTGLVNGTVLHLAAFFAAVSRHVSFPELSHSTATFLRRFAKDVKVAEWRMSALSLADKLRESARLVAEARGRAEFGPHGAAGSSGVLERVPGLDESKRNPVQRFYDVEVARVKREENLRDEALLEKSKTDRYDIQHESKQSSKMPAEQNAETEEGSDAMSDASSDSDNSDGSVENRRERTVKRSEGARQRVQIPQIRFSEETLGVSGEESDEVGELVLSSDDEQ